MHIYTHIRRVQFPVRILRPPCTRVSGLYRRIPSVRGMKRCEGERMPSDNVLSADFRTRGPSSSSSLLRALGLKAGIKCTTWQFFSDFTGSIAGFTIRKKISACALRYFFLSIGKNSTGTSRPGNFQFRQREIRRSSMGYLLSNESDRKRIDRSAREQFYRLRKMSFVIQRCVSIIRLKFSTRGAIIGLIDYIIRDENVVESA